MDTILQEISFHKTKKKQKEDMFSLFLPFACQKSSFFIWPDMKESFSNDADICLSSTTPLPWKKHNRWEIILMYLSISSPPTKEQNQPVLCLMLL